MISLKEMESEIQRALKQMKEGESLTFKTHKKDRSLTLEKSSNGFTILENGYQKRVYPDLDVGSAKRKMKSLMETEFPRSHQVWVQRTENAKQCESNREDRR